MKSLVAKLLQERDQGRGGELGTDFCPRCGHVRREMRVAPGRFYCERCDVAGPREGPLRALLRKL